MKRFTPEQIKELKALQKDNQRLRRIIADQWIDMEILKEVIEFKRLGPRLPAQGANQRNLNAIARR